MFHCEMLVCEIASARIRKPSSFVCMPCTIGASHSRCILVSLITQCSSYSLYLVKSRCTIITALRHLRNYKLSAPPLHFIRVANFGIQTSAWFTAELFRLKKRHKKYFNDECSAERRRKTCSRLYTYIRPCSCILQCALFEAPWCGWNEQL